MKQKRVEKLFLLCSLVLIIFVQKMEMAVYAEEYEYDGLNRVTKVIYDDGSYVEYIYDSNGNIIETIVSSNISEDSSVEQDSSEADDRFDETTESEESDITVESNGGTQTDESTESQKPQEPVDSMGAGETNNSSAAGKSTEATESVESEQSIDSSLVVAQIKEEITEFFVSVEDLFQDIIYLQDTAQKIKEYAQNVQSILDEWDA